LGEGSKAPETREQIMKIEQAKQIATKAIEELSQALEADHSEKLREYLRAMARFHRYSWHNVMLIASQRAVTCCYTSLESMKIRSCALLEANDGA
jgi:hypothetical protein